MPSEGAVRSKRLAERNRGVEIDMACGLPIVKATQPRAGEFAREWPIVATCFAGLVLAVGTIVTYTAGVFSVAITREFG